MKLKMIRSLTDSKGITLLDENKARAHRKPWRRIEEVLESEMRLFVTITTY